MNSHATGPGPRLGGYGTLSTEILTDYHHISFIKLTERSLVHRNLGILQHVQTYNYYFFVKLITVHEGIDTLITHVKQNIHLNFKIILYKVGYILNKIFEKGLNGV